MIRTIRSKPARVAYARPSPSIATCSGAAEAGAGGGILKASITGSRSSSTTAPAWSPTSWSPTHSAKASAGGVTGMTAEPPAARVTAGPAGAQSNWPHGLAPSVMRRLKSAVGWIVRGTASRLTIPTCSVPPGARRVRVVDTYASAFSIATVTPAPGGGAMPGGSSVRTRMIGITPVRSCAAASLANCRSAGRVLSAFQICFSGESLEIFCAPAVGVG